MSTQNLTLSGKVAIVTGASRGIGADIALELARRGANVAVVYASPSSDAAAANLVGTIQALPHKPSAVSIRTDLRSLDAPAAIVNGTLTIWGPHIDILVNNAGCELVAPIAATSAAQFAHVFDLNVRAPMLLTAAVQPHLRAPGRIVNISSVGARRGFSGLAVYCSSKAALEGLTRCSAVELGEAGHTVNAVSPGPVETEMLANIPNEIVEMQKRDTPVQKRLGTVNDVAQIVGFLAEEGSRWVSGQVLSASGGWAMY